MGSSAAYHDWYLAGGDTASSDNDSLALTNTNSSAVQVQVTYYATSGSPTVKSYSIAANAQIRVPDSDGGGQASGRAIHATLPIIVQHSLFVKQNGVSGGVFSMA